MKTGLYPLLIAIKNEDIFEIERLLKRGTEINIAEKSGITPLMAASTTGNARIVQLLLDHGADPQMRSNNGQTAINFAKSEFIKNLLHSTLAEPVTPFHASQITPSTKMVTEPGLPKNQNYQPPADGENMQLGDFDLADHIVDTISLREDGLYKIEIDSYMETSLNAVIFISGAFAFLALIEGEKIASSLIILFLSAIAFRYCVDDYYLVDVQNKVILYHQSWLGFTTQNVVCRFDEIIGISVTGKRCSSKHRSWWEYGLVMGTNDGKLHRLTSTQEISMTDANRFYNNFSKSIGLPFVHGQLEQKAVVVQDPTAFGQYKIEHQERGFFS